MGWKTTAAVLLTTSTLALACGSEVDEVGGDHAAGGGVLILPGWLVQMEDGGVSSLPVLFQFLLAISLIWTVLEILTMLTNDKRRALHDYIAGTVVVKVDVAASPETVVAEEK